MSPHYQLIAAEVIEAILICIIIPIAITGKMQAVKIPVGG